jgi:hypothetical protein
MATLPARQRFAAIVPVGPGPIDVAIDLIDSIACWQPGLEWCVFVEDRPYLSDLAPIVSARYGCLAKSVRNPRRECAPAWVTSHHWYSGINAGILEALSWLHAHSDAEFILRIDTDALVVGPFSDVIRQCHMREPGAGVLGCLNGSCNLVVRALFDESREPYLLRLRRSKSSELESPHAREVVDAFEAIRPHVDEAVRHGYATSRHCQGGACAITRRMLERMVDAGYLCHTNVWLNIPIADDMVLAMYAYAVGLRPMDCDGFGVQFRALAYSPEELLARGYGIIHSVRNDHRFSETAIRQFFRQRRQGGQETVCK